MEKKTKRTNIKKDHYGFDTPEGLAFDEYWEQYHKLEDISTKESIRQKEYRQKWQSDTTQIGVKVCAKCGNEECICEYFDK